MVPPRGRDEVRTPTRADPIPVPDLGQGSVFALGSRRMMCGLREGSAMDLADLIVEREEEGYFAYHRSALTSEALHRAELEHIFNRCWLYLGHESEIPEPGDFVRRTVATRPLFFVRSRTTGDVRVFANSCIHRGATICRRDRGNVKSFQCFYHAWTFDSDGTLF